MHSARFSNSGRSRVVDIIDWCVEGNENSRITRTKRDILCHSLALSRPLSLCFSTTLCLGLILFLHIFLSHGLSHSHALSVCHYFVCLSLFYPPVFLCFASYSPCQVALFVASINSLLSRATYNRTNIPQCHRCQIGGQRSASGPGYNYGPQENFRPKYFQWPGNAKGKSNPLI